MKFHPFHPLMNTAIYKDRGLHLEDKVSSNKTLTPTELAAKHPKKMMGRFWKRNFTSNDVEHIGTGNFHDT